MLPVCINPEIAFASLGGGDDTVINLVFLATMVSTATRNADVQMRNHVIICPESASAHQGTLGKTATPFVHQKRTVKNASLDATVVETQCVITSLENVCAS